MPQPQPQPLRPRRGVHVHDRSKKEKEFRFASSPALQGAGALYGAATEVKDTLDAIAKAMPKSYYEAYKKQKGLHKKALYVLRNARNVNATDAAYNIATDQLQDMAIGKANQAAARITKNPHWVSPRGPSVSRAGTGSFRW